MYPLLKALVPFTSRKYIVMLNCLTASWPWTWTAP